MEPKENLKYKIKSNNYFSLIFFAMVLASLLYIIKYETNHYIELEPPKKDIMDITPKKTEITTPTEEILNLTRYLNTGDVNLFKTYQSSYIYNDSVSNDDYTTESMLHIAYKYLEKTNDFTKHTRYITCEEAKLVGLENNILQCGGQKQQLSYYTLNTFVTKDVLKRTVQKIFNKNIKEFKNFYTTEDNLCYFINNEYLCISHKTNPTNKYTEKEFIKAYKTTNKIEIIEKYRFVNDGIYYKGFNSDEVGEEYYISTFVRVNGNFYLEETKVYEQTS